MRDEEKTKKELLEELALLRLQLKCQDLLPEGNKEGGANYAFLEILLNNISDMAYICDDKGNVLYLNHAFDRLSGHKAEAFINNSFAPLFDGDDLTKAIDGYTTTLKGDSPTFEVAFKETGTLCSYKNTPFRDKDGSIIGVMGIARDITEQRRMEQALSISRHKYKSLFQNMLNGAAYHEVVLDEKGRPVDYIFLEVNDAFEHQTGLNKESIIGKKVTEVIPGIEHTKPDLISIYGKVALTGEGCTFELYFEPFDRWYSVSASCPEKGFFVAVFQDISEAKRREEELSLAKDDLEAKVKERTRELTRINELLRASESYHRTLVETIPYGIQENDLSGIITFSNSANAEITGYSQKELVGKAIWDFYDKEEGEKLRRYFNKIARDQPPPGTYTGKKRRKDGRLIDVRGDWNYKRNEKGDLVGFITIISDITDQKRAELEVGNKLHYSRSMAEINKAFEGDYDIDKMLTATLSKMLSIFKADRAWLLFPVDLNASSFRVPYQVTTPEYPVEGVVEIPIEGDETAIGVYEQALASKEPMTFEFDEAELPAEGMFTDMVKKYQIRSQMVVTLHPRLGEPWMLGLHQCSYAREWSEEDQRLFKDISARLTDAVTGTLLYKDLKASEEKFRSIFESSNDAMMLLDENGFFDCNAATLKIFACSSRDEFIGSHPVEWSPATQPENRSSIEAAEEKIATAYHEGRNFFEWTHRRANGEEFPAEVLLTAMRLGGKDVLQATVRDITERKRAEEEKKKLQAQLIQAQRMEAIGTLAGGIAHDFNNIMTVIKNLTALAMNKMDQTDEDCPFSHYLRPIREVSERGINLVQQLLIFSKNRPVELSYQNMNDVIDDFLKIIGTLISEDITIKKKLEQGLWDIKADKGRIEQVLTNLVINSRDSLLMGGTITLRTENITLTADKAASMQGASAGNFICLTVQDNGKGMENDVLEHVFEPFFTTKAPQGSGLGLSVVYGIVKEMGGWINVTSEANRGTRFMVYLPISMGTGKTLKAKPVKKKAFNGEGRRILLVEDDKWVRKSTAMVLTENGYAVFEASSAEQAISLFYKEKGRFDLVMSDVVMPGKTGLQLVSPLLDINPNTPILLCSGHLDDKAQLEQIIKRGIPYIQKPFEIEDLLQAIEDVIEENS